ncbi:MAG TPA: hypothetical protein VJ864_00565 [Candidatus Binatia bacterium]|nr:hypothetical protein [Candidatus Binatia bacterium]
MSATAIKQSSVINGIDVDAVKDIVEQIKDDPTKGLGGVSGEVFMEGPDPLRDVD